MNWQRALRKVIVHYFSSEFCTKLLWSHPRNKSTSVKWYKLQGRAKGNQSPSQPCGMSCPQQKFPIIPICASFYLCVSTYYVSAQYFWKLLAISFRIALLFIPFQLWNGNNEIWLSCMYSNLAITTGHFWAVMHFSELQMFQQYKKKRMSMCLSAAWHGQMILIAFFAPRTYTAEKK